MNSNGDATRLPRIWCRGEFFCDHIHLPSSAIDYDGGVLSINNHREVADRDPSSMYVLWLEVKRLGPLVCCMIIALIAWHLRVILLFILSMSAASESSKVKERAISVRFNPLELVL